MVKMFDLLEYISFHSVVRGSLCTACVVYKSLIAVLSYGTKNESSKTKRK